mmetsp:Transcript_49197/g.59343  ORF Transcript_49197/g.59343 Transcript_49197/m.59343 type:complete len:111 (+) Transcript_49197:76-408(+)
MIHQAGTHQPQTIRCRSLPSISMRKVINIFFFLGIILTFRRLISLMDVFDVDNEHKMQQEEIRNSFSVKNQKLKTVASNHEVVVASEAVVASEVLSLDGRRIAEIATETQ